MKIRNGFIVDLANFLYQLQLSNKESRMRTRFHKLLVEHQTNVIDVERKMLIEEYADRDENGEMVYISENEVSIKDAFYLNYNELLNEFFIIDTSESNKDMLLTVANVVLNTDYKFSGELADIYDIWCEEFEQVIEYYNKEEA